MVDLNKEKVLKVVQLISRELDTLQLYVKGLEESIETGQFEAPLLGRGVVTAYSRAFKLMPDPSSKSSKDVLNDLRQKVLDAVKKGGMMTDPIEDLKIHSTVIPLDCSNVRNSPDGITSPLSHLTAAGYPQDSKDCLLILGKKCQYPGCTGTYVWADLPSPDSLKNHPPPRR